jgi:hypothetical protein
MPEIIRKITFTLTLMLIMLPLSAQNDVKQAINEIKRSPAYFYAESTMADEGQARDAANVLLAQFINDYVKENSISGVERVTSDNLNGVEYKSMPRGTMTRVFAYVHRSVYIPGYQDPTGADNGGGSGSGGGSGVGSGGGSDFNSATAIAGANNKPVVAVISGELSMIGRRAVGELLAEADLPSAVKQLAKLKSENIVKRYGTIRDCRNTAASCWIIAQSDSGMAIVTILGPGSDTRTNFKTDSDDSLANYSGYNAVWFELN